MKSTVRRSLRTAGLVLAGVLAAGCSGGSSSGSDASALASGSAVELVTKAETPQDASRFLAQATFGPTRAEVDRLTAADLDAWLAAQFAKPHAETMVGYWRERLALQPGGGNTEWLYHGFWRHAIAGDEALRHRVAFALAQIFVVSLVDPNVSQFPRGVASYHDTLAAHAFGNFRDLLEAVSLHPMMGLYLSHLRNRGDDGRVPDENYAREVMQLFTIGLQELNPDGTPKRGPDGRPIDTYGNDDVTGLARVFTGWSWAGPDRGESRFNGGNSPSFPDRDITRMQAYPQFHADAPKTFLGVTCPGGVMPAVSLGCALDRLFTHPNTAPFFARQLIQRLVTSNPSPGYVARVAAAFSDDGGGRRGELKAVLRAVLLDPEARRTPAADDAVYGKPREPILRLTALLRATNASSRSGQYRIGNTDDPVNALGQTALRSPSVFNYWRPGYTPPNSELAARDLVAPELQAANETTVAGYLNVVRSVIESGFGADSPRDVQPELARLISLAHDTDALLAEIGVLLTSTGYRPETRTRIRDVLASITIPMADAAAQTARRSRVRVALFLTVGAPEFLAQK